MSLSISILLALSNVPASYQRPIGGALLDDDHVEAATKTLAASEKASKKAAKVKKAQKEKEATATSSAEKKGKGKKAKLTLREKLKAKLKAEKEKARLREKKKKTAAAVAAVEAAAAARDAYFSRVVFVKPPT